MRTVLLVDGPNAGQVIQADNSAEIWVVAPPPEPVSYSPDLNYEATMLLPAPTPYRLTRIAFFDRRIEVGWSGPEPEPPFRALAAHLLSGAARKAMF